MTYEPRAEGLEFGIDGSELHHRSCENCLCSGTCAVVCGCVEYGVNESILAGRSIILGRSRSAFKTSLKFSRISKTFRKAIWVQASLVKAEAKMGTKEVIAKLRILPDPQRSWNAAAGC